MIFSSNQSGMNARRNLTSNSFYKMTISSMEIVCAFFTVPREMLSSSRHTTAILEGILVGTRLCPSFERISIGQRWSETPCDTSRDVGHATLPKVMEVTQVYTLPYQLLKLHGKTLVWTL